MSTRFLRGLAWIVGALTVTMAIVGALIRIVGPAQPQTFNIGSGIDFVAEAVTASIYAFIGVLLAQRLPRHPVPWIFLVIGLCLAGVVLTWAYAVAAFSQPVGHSELPLAREGLLIDTAVLQPAGIALLVCLLVQFPDGRPIDRTSRRILALVPFTAALIALGICMTPTDLGIFTGVRNPLQLGFSTEAGRAVSAIGVVMTVALGALGVRSQLTRYRAAGAVQRQQIRWFLWAGALAVVMAGGVLVLLALFPNILETPAEAIVIVVFSIGGAAVPLACAVAIRRYRLYDIDRLISQTFVYTALIALVAGVYSALITGLQRLSVVLTGEETDFSVVLTTLILAVAFEPAKKRLEAFAERFRDDSTARAADKPVGMSDDEVELIVSRVVERMREERAR
jgi:hypothetical protein